MYRRLIPLVLLALVLTACNSNAETASPPSVPTAGRAAPTNLATASASTPSSTATSSGASTATTLTTGASSITARPVAGSRRLFVEVGPGGPTDQLAQLKPGDGSLERKTPAGVPSPDWKTLYTVTVTGEQRTTVTALNLSDGSTLRSTTFNGQFKLPLIDSGSRLGGLSQSGKTLVLSEGLSRQPRQSVSRFAILDTSALESPPRLLELPGQFEYDVVSADGTNLFLIEHLPASNPAGGAGKYQVRVYDLAANRLIAEPVVEKGEQETVMEGYGGAQVISSDGEWVFTVYRNSSHGPFVHGLNTKLRQAACLNLPTLNKENEAAALNWSLAMNQSGSSLYVVNPVLGQVVEISPVSWPEIRRTQTITAVPLSQERTSPVGWATATVSADGKKLFVVANKGLSVIDTATLKSAGQLAAEWKFNSVLSSPDSTQLYASSTDKGKIVVLDVNSEVIVTEVGYKGQPQVLLKVESNQP